MSFDQLQLYSLFGTSFSRIPCLIFGKAVRFLDGREFPSKAAAAKVLGVSKAAIYYAVRTGSPCKGHVIQAQTGHRDCFEFDSFNNSV